MDRKEQLKWLLRAHEAGLLSPEQSQALNTHFGLLKAKRDGNLDEAGFSALAKGDFLDMARPDIGKAEAGARGAVQGVSLGFADEVAGALRGLISDDSMATEIEKSRVRDALAKMDERGVYTTGEVGGAIAGALVPGGAIARTGKAGLSLAKKAGTLAGAGAVQEGLRGAGLGEGEGKASGAVRGALTGAAVGAAFPVSGAALKSALGSGSILRNSLEYTALNSILPGSGTALAVGRGAHNMLAHSRSALHGPMAKPVHRVAGEYAARRNVPIEDVLNPKLKRSFARVRPTAKQRAVAHTIDLGGAGGEAAEIAARLAAGQAGIGKMLGKNIGGQAAVKAYDVALSRARKRVLEDKLAQIGRMPTATRKQEKARFKKIEDLLRSLTSRERSAVLKHWEESRPDPITAMQSFRGLGGAGAYGSQAGQ